MALASYMIWQYDIRHHPGWLPYLTVGGAAERGPVHGIWSLWRRRSVKVCTAFPFTFSFPQSCGWFCKTLFLVFSRMVGGDVTVAWMDHKYCIFNLQQYCPHLKENDDADDDVDQMIMLLFFSNRIIVTNTYVLLGPGRVTRKTTILMQRVSALAAEEPVPISELSSSLLLLIVFTWRPKDSKNILVNDCLISARSAVERTMCDFSTLLLSMSSPCWLLDNPLQPKIGNFNVYCDRVMFLLLL